MAWLPVGRNCIGYPMYYIHKKNIQKNGLLKNGDVNFSHLRLCYLSITNVPSVIDGILIIPFSILSSFSSDGLLKIAVL